MTNYTDDLYVKEVPSDLKIWLNENSPIAPNWMEVYQRWHEFNKNIEETKDYFRRMYMNDTSNMYDKDHPNVNDVL